MMKYYFYILCFFNLYTFTSEFVYSADLLEVYNIALKNDPTILSVEAEHNANLQKYPIARSYLLPNISFSASTQRARESIDGSVYGSSTSASKYNTDEYSINLKQPLYRRDLLVLLERSEYEVAKSLAMRDSARQNLIIRVTQSYFNLLDAIDDISYSDSEKLAIKSQLEESKKRFEVGLIAMPELAEAQAAYDLAVTNYIEAENRGDLAKESLYVLTGKQFDSYAILKMHINPKDPEPNNIKDWEDFAIKQNLDLLVAKKAQDIAVANVKYEDSKHFPTLDIYGAAKKTDKGGGSSGAYEANNDYIGIELNIPIFIGGNTYYSVKQAAYTEEKIRYELLKTQREVIKDTRQAFLNLKSSISMVNSAEKALKSNHLSVEYNNEGYEVGTRTTTDVLIALKELFKAKKNYSKAKYEYFMSKLKLKKSIGTLSAEDIEIINSWLS